jgi:hypothetical protein
MHFRENVLVPETSATVVPAGRNVLKTGSGAKAVDSLCNVTVETEVSQRKGREKMEEGRTPLLPRLQASKST